MKNLKYFNQLNEGRKHLTDLKNGILFYINEEDLTITIHNIDNDKTMGFISMRLDRSGGYNVSSVAGLKGYGPLMYELGMMYCYTKDSMLMVNRDGDIRDEAFNVWKNFYKRKDILKETLDITDKRYNFAILTGETEFEEGLHKYSEFDYHESEGHGDTLKIYNTRMSMKPSDDFDTESVWEDTEDISDKGREFFSVMYK